MPASRSLLAALLAMLPQAAQAFLPAQRYNLTNPAARCLDGTRAPFYFAPATSAAYEKVFTIYLPGGGECADEAACKAATQNQLGSANYYTETQWLPYLSDGNCTSNPLLCQANRVSLSYCSQDLHSGMVTQASNETWGLYFAGHLSFRAMLDELDAMGLKSAEQIVLHGASAGGIGVWINVAYLQDRYPQARVTGVSIAGFYFYEQFYTGVNASTPGLADFRAAAWPGHMALWQAYANEACVADKAHNSGDDGPWSCLLANYSWPYIKSDMMVVEAQTDMVVLEAHCGIPYNYYTQQQERGFIQAWKNNMTDALAPFMQPSHPWAVFNPACFIHTSFDGQQPAIGGLSYMEAFVNWYTAATGPAGWKLQDACSGQYGDLFCNPTCPSD